MHRPNELDLSEAARTVLDMTTTETPPAPPWDRVLMCMKFGLTTITAEYHPQDWHGAMKYSLHVEGGYANGVVIHCKTEQSVTQLFTEVVATQKVGITHPYLTVGLYN